MKKINKNDFIKAKMHTIVTPAQAIKIIRELQEISQNQLAEMTGISQSNISALENASCQLGRDRAIMLAKALHVHPAVLLFPDYQIEQAA